MTFETENDTEVAGCRTCRTGIERARGSGKAMEGTLTDLDGFFTFVVGTRNGFAWCATPSPASPR
jgi:hypothetical protein